MKILFLVPYPLKEAPSQRFRFEQYFALLVARGHSFEVRTFLSPTEGKLFSEQGKYFQKFWALMRGFGARILSLFSIRQFDFVFIHREVTPLGPPLIEWFIAKVLRRKIIYDFDDAIWLTDKKDEHPVVAFLKWRSKVRSICRWSYRISCGNEFLRDYAAQFNNLASVNPTTIDTSNVHHRELYPKKNSDHLTIGWTGSRSTLKYLESMVPVIRRLEQKYPTMQFLVIADKKPDLDLKSMVFKQWSIETEIDDLSKFDIGIMPLDDDPWSKGKCGFKALQYMSLEIPPLVSPVGVNLKIVQDGVNGFLCDVDRQWTDKICLLMDQPSLREKLGKAARRTIEENYSVNSNSETFLSLFSLFQSKTRPIR